MSLDSILRATGKNLLSNPNVHAYNYSSDYKKYNNTDEIFLTAGIYSVSVSANCPTLQFWNVTTKQQYTVDEAVSAYSTNTYYKVYEGFALGKASDTVRQMWFTLKINALITLNSGNTNGTSQECQIEKGSTATTYEPFHRILQSVKIPSNGENLTPYPYAENDKTENGITFVTGYYSGIKMNGTVSSDLPMGFTIVDNLDLTAGDYTFSSGYNGTVIPNGVVVQLNYLEDNIPKGVAALSGSKLQETFSIDDTLAQKKFRATIVLNTGMSGSFSVNNLLLCPTLVKSGSKEVLKVSYNSRNLIPYPYFSNTITNNGVTYTVNANGSIKISGTASADNNSVFFIRSNTLPLTLKQGEQYTLSGHIEGSGVTFSMQDSSFKQTISVTNPITSKSFTTLYSNYHMWLVVLKGTTVDTVVYPQLELGDKATDYVPYFNTVVWEKQEIVATNKLGSFKLGESMLA